MDIQSQASESQKAAEDLQNPANIVKPADLTQKEQVFAHYKLQVRIKSSIDQNAIHKLGARRLGTVHHEDKFFIPRDKSIGHARELIRIRKEADKYVLFVYKGPVADENQRTTLTTSEIIPRARVIRIKKNYRKIVSIDKTRTLFLLNSIVINVDTVLNLGAFVEFLATDLEHSSQIDSLIQKLGLDTHKSTRLSYFELALMNQKRWQKVLTAIHDHFGRFSFGISSAVLTTLGMVVGLNAATASRLAVVAGIVAVAVADSLSDSMGIYTSQRVEGGTTDTGAILAAINTFLGKFIFTLSFIVPFLFLSFSIAIYTSIIWGAILLGLVSVQIAFVQEESIPKTILKNEIVAASIIIISYLAGRCVALLT